MQAFNKSMTQGMKRTRKQAGGFWKHCNSLLPVKVTTWYCCSHWKHCVFCVSCLDHDPFHPIP